MTFKLSEEQKKKLKDWMAGKNLNLYEGAMGGRFSYTFTPTSIGMVVTVKDALEKKDQIDLSDYENW